MPPLLLLGLVAAAYFSGVAGEVATVYKKLSSDLPFNLYPMIMAHDAATGELDEARDHVVADWARTQSVGLVGQLDCGARSFDYRPALDKDGTIFPKHGPVTIHKSMKSSVLELISWTEKHPSELVVLYLSHFDGDGCQDSVTALLTELKVPMIKDCSLLSLPYQQIQTMATLSVGKGRLLAVFDCMAENYDPSIECYGKDFVCYDSWPENTTQVAFSAFDAYMTSTTSADPTLSSTNLWMAQGHWQSSAQSVVHGTLHRSSLLLDEERSQANQHVASVILQEGYPFLNVLELDHVCDKGDKVSEAIEAVYLSRPGPLTGEEKKRRK